MVISSLPAHDVGLKDSQTTWINQPGSGQVQTGGMLSHAACVSREFGIPAVQLPRAQTLIEDGATITINGDTGKVTVHVDEAEAGTEPIGAAGVR